MAVASPPNVRPVKRNTPILSWIHHCTFSSIVKVINEYTFEPESLRSQSPYQFPTSNISRQQDPTWSSLADGTAQTRTRNGESKQTTRRDVILRLIWMGSSRDLVVESFQMYNDPTNATNVWSDSVICVCLFVCVVCLFVLFIVCVVYCLCCLLFVVLFVWLFDCFVC